MSGIEQNDVPDEKTSAVCSRACISPESVEQDMEYARLRNVYYRENNAKNAALAQAVIFSESVPISPTEVVDVARVFEAYLLEIEIPTVPYL